MRDTEIPMPETKQLTLPITGMYCANCVSTIERNLKKVHGVRQAAVNLASERAVVEYDPGEAHLRRNGGPHSARRLRRGIRRGGHPTEALGR